MRIVFYDSETTGLTLSGVESDDPRQPRIVQLGAIVYDTEAEAVVDRLDRILKPEGWTIPSKVAAIHGITTERAMAEGQPHREVIAEFIDMWRGCDHRVGFNESFDRKLVRIHLKCYFERDKADEWLVGSASCMMRASTSICRLPATENQLRRNPATKWKQPRLTEAHEILVGSKLAGAHSAMADAEGTLRIWLQLRARGELPEPRRLELKHDDRLAEERMQQHEEVRRQASYRPSSSMHDERFS